MLRGMDRAWGWAGCRGGEGEELREQPRHCQGGEIRRKSRVGKEVSSVLGRLRLGCRGHAEVVSCGRGCPNVYLRAWRTGFL